MCLSLSLPLSPTLSLQSYVIDMCLSLSLSLSHLALQHSAVVGAGELLQSLGSRPVEGFRQQEAEAACRQAAQTEHRERHRGVESPL